MIKLEFENETCTMVFGFAAVEKTVDQIGIEDFKDFAGILEKTPLKWQKLMMHNSVSNLYNRGTQFADFSADDVAQLYDLQSDAIKQEIMRGVMNALQTWSQDFAQSVGGNSGNAKKTGKKVQAKK